MASYPPLIVSAANHHPITLVWRYTRPHVICQSHRGGMPARVDAWRRFLVLASTFSDHTRLAFGSVRRARLHAQMADSAIGIDTPGSEPRRQVSGGVERPWRRP
jgi:hypothetical protein